MAFQNPFEFMWKLMGSGSQTRYDQIQRFFDQGGDILSAGGSELFHTEIQNDSATTFNNTSFADLAGWVAPPLVWTGQPWFILLDIPAVQNTVANAVTTFRVVDGGGVELLTAAADQLATGAVRKAYSFCRIAKDGLYTPTVGATLNLKVQAKVSAGTTTLHTYFNNGLFGTTTAIFRGMRQ